jgi:hypothetical protein
MKNSHSTCTAGVTAGAVSYCIMQKEAQEVACVIFPRCECMAAPYVANPTADVYTEPCFHRALLPHFSA